MVSQYLIINMFKKSERLTKVEFSSYWQTAKRHHFPHFTILVAKKNSDNSDVLKVAVVVGKKVARSAARRNTIRRRVYAQIRKNVTENKYLGVIIVMIKPSYNSLTRKTAEKELQKLIADVLKNA